MNQNYLALQTRDEFLNKTQKSEDSWITNIWLKEPI